MSRGILLIIAAVILSASLFLPWHYSVEERPMYYPTRSSSDGDKVILACWHNKQPPVIGYHTPIVLIVVVPLATLLGVCGLLFIARPNIQGWMVKFVPAAIAAIGVIALSRILYTLDYPDTGGSLALIAAICSVPISFVTKTESQPTGPGYRPPAAGSA